MNPRVSIIIPLFDKARYIGDTVRSVIDQSEASWELLAVDNGSTDEGPEIVRSLDDPRVKLVASPKKGASAARNYGFDLAVGEWVVFLDADDLLIPDYLKSQLAAAADSDLVVCPYVEFVDGEPDRRQIKHPWQGAASRAAMIGSAIVFAPGPTHSFLIRRTFLRPELNWPEHLDRLLGEDAVYWFRLINEARMGFNPEPAALYRFWTPESRFTTLSDPARLFSGLHAAITENLTYLDGRGQAPTFEQSEQLMRFYGGTYLQARQQGDRATQRSALREARRWQDRYFQDCPRPSLPMRVRRYLGLRLFTRLLQHS